MKNFKNAIIPNYKKGERRVVSSMEILEETIVERRQKLLDKLVTEELLDLEKSVKFKDRQFLEKKLIVVAVNMDGKNYYNGLYQKIENKRNSTKYLHKIKISNSQLDNYFNVKDCSSNTKTYEKENIRKIIRHELIHALTNEIICDCTKIEGADRECSPFFLSLLYWLGGDSDHNCVQAFEKSKIYKETKYINDFHLLYMYLVNKLSEYEKVISELEIYTIRKTHISNQFSFAHMDAGLLANYTVRCSAKDVKTGIIIEYITNDFEIGCCIMPNDIEKYFIRKCLNNNFMSCTRKISYFKDNYLCIIKNGKLNKVKIK